MKNTSINKNAKIGKGTVINPFSVIEEDVVIGENCIVDSHAIIKNGSRIGNNCKVFPGAVIGTIPQDLKYNGEKTTVEIGNNTSIREYVTINIGTEASGKTIIGNDVLVMAYSHVAHDCTIEDRAVLANSVQLAGHVKIGFGTVIGGVSGIIQFTRVGKNVMIQGGTLVSKDVPPYITVASMPQRYAGINRIGLQRYDFSQEEIDLINRIYRKFYHTKSSIPNAITEIREAYKDLKVKDEILNFITSDSKQGILRKSMITV